MLYSLREDNGEGLRNSFSPHGQKIRSQIIIWTDFGCITSTFTHITILYVCK